MPRRWLLLVMALEAGGCRATTGRPGFTPFPEAEHTEIGFDLADEDQTVFQVTDTIAARLRSDSIPLDQVRTFDGYIQSRWFDARTKKPWVGRVLGPDAVRVRAWVDPGKPGFSKVEVETVFVPKADPSLPSRELEVPVATEHPINRQMGELLKTLAKSYGPPEDEKKPDAAGDRAPGDTTGGRRPTTPATRPPGRIPTPTPPPPPPPPPPPSPPPAAPPRAA